ncbi:MHYT domain-containing protein [Streptomyces sp. NPDC002073]|uniref:MHYT domain-containing protein n=1 Tax=Streptomyces sp. NBC_00239 TaxID=2903640 RepID=UPI002E28B7E3|nr:MHYT domain-containing protein [Streptomyces sp. NBC_00239]
MSGTYGTVDGFSYGLITPLAAYLMACLGGALGLRCTTRSLLVERSWRPGWLALGATAIGSGIWTMHFIAMMGFSVAESPLNYDKRTTFASLGVAIVMVGIGIFIVGYRGSTPMSLVTGGTITGLGVASMHYLGMAGMRLHGHLEYDTKVVALSVVVAVVASTAALWAAVSVRGLLPAIGASLVMGLAVTGMHYTAMTALRVRIGGGYGELAGDRPTTLLAPLLIGPVVFLIVAAVVVMFDPLLVMGTQDWQKPGEVRYREPVPQRPVWPARPTYEDSSYPREP